jgi:hypothetical protein
MNSAEIQGEMKFRRLATPPLLPTTVNFPAPPSSAPQVIMIEPATLRRRPTRSENEPAGVDTSE